MLKSARYAEAGSPGYWIVDPLSVNERRPAVEVYDLDDADDVADGVLLGGSDGLRAGLGERWFRCLGVGCRAERADALG